MNLKPFRKVLVGCAAALTAAGIAFGGMTSASADPISPTGPRVINVYGSDTTQDVLNGAANSALDAAGAKYIASWDAGTTNALSPIAAAVGSPAPNGSGEGVAALKAAMKNELWKGKTVVGKIQAARSSSAPKAADLSTTGELQYIPFARDAVTYATAPTTVVPNGIPLDHTAGTNGLSLKRIFTCEVGSFDFGGKKYHTVGAPAGSIKLEPIRLQDGSGTRSFWEGVIGAPTLADTCLATVTQEHNGQAIAAKPNTLAPFSISQWIAQKNAGAANQNNTAGTALGISVNDRRFGAVLKNVGNNPLQAAPIKVGLQNPDFVPALTRNVFNVIPAAAVGDLSTPVNAALNNAFVGAGAAASSTTTIQKFGFSTALKDGYTPGQVSPALRVKL